MRINKKVKKESEDSKTEGKIKLEKLYSKPDSLKTKLEYIELDPERCATLMKYLSDLTGNL